MTCKVEGCNRPAHARGYCATHYGQLWRTGEITSHIYTKVRRSRKPFDRAATLKELDELRHELAEAHDCYDRVIGIANRLFWLSNVASLRVRCTALEKRLAEYAKPITIEVEEIPIEQLLAEEVPDGENAEGRTGA